MLGGSLAEEAHLFEELFDPLCEGRLSLLLEEGGEACFPEEFVLEVVGLDDSVGVEEEEVVRLEADRRRLDDVELLGAEGDPEGGELLETLAPLQVGGGVPLAAVGEEFFFWIVEGDPEGDEHRRLVGVEPKEAVGLEDDLGEGLAALGEAAEHASEA